MNKQLKDDSDNNQVTGLGKALRQGRENKSFSVSRVADGLHLRPSIVTAIEDEDYDLLPGDLFLKGYIRSYARLVGLDEEKMINLLDQRLSDQANEKTVKKQALSKQKRQKNSKHAILVLVIAGIVGAAFYMWSQRLGDANIGVFDTATESVADTPIIDSDPVDTTDLDPQGFTETVELTENAQAEIVNTEAKPDEAPVVNEPINDVASESTQGLLVDDASLASVSSEPSVEPVSEIEQTFEIEPKPVVELEQDVRPNLDVVQESEVLSADVVETELPSADSSLKIGEVRVTFSGDCWFTLKNGEGKTIYADLNRAGDEINYSGPAPFQLVIGAVSEVSVFFEQEPVDFSTVRVRNNRAELELTH